MLFAGSVEPDDRDRELVWDLATSFISPDTDSDERGDE